MPGRVAPAAGEDVRARFVPWNQGAPPALALKDLDGRAHALADYRGTVVLVNFWATWCDPCQDEMPSLRRLRDRLAGEPFAILGVNHGGESTAKVRAFRDRLDIDFPLLLDPGGETPRGWRVRVLPASFVVGRDGRVRYHVIGEIDWASADALAVIRGLLR
jgi:peroxiredoxin